MQAHGNPPQLQVKHGWGHALAPIARRRMTAKTMKTPRHTRLRRSRDALIVHPHGGT